MKKTLAVLLLGVISFSFAQQNPSTEEINNRFSLIASQRNIAMDNVVVLQARLAIVEEELKKVREMKCSPEKDKAKGK
jgi:paraquat-inducible protein B